MSELGFIKDPEKPERKRNNKFGQVLFYRWLFIIAGIPLFYATSGIVPSLVSFLLTMGVGMGYNLLITLYGKEIYPKHKRFPDFVIYLDIILICVLGYQLGGINSEIYILFLFLLCFGENCTLLTHTMLVSVFCATAYSFMCICFDQVHTREINFLRLAFKDFFLIFAGYATYFLNEEIRKYTEMHKKEFKLARTDKLTGLPNRHYLEQMLSGEVHNADSSGMPLNVLIFDLDNFKKFNDSYGHIWGDKLLSLFSDIIKQNIRDSDIPIRYGGEEFMILVRDLDLQLAKLVGERVRSCLEKQKIYVGEDQKRIKMTVSCGIAQYPFDSEDIRRVIDCADKALYHAKEIGKNTIVSYREIGKIKRPVPTDIETYMGG